MARKFSPLTLDILEALNQAAKPVSSKSLFKQHGKGINYKEFYNLLFRISELDLAKKEKGPGEVIMTITEEGKKILLRNKPKKDGVWKLVIFDIPEKQKKVRQILRGKLKALQFKKWQNSIWVSPYQLDEEVESELKTLADKFFVRLIKTTDINETKDLEKLFNT
jgi:predicted transcriptional regulator